MNKRSFEKSLTDPLTFWSSKSAEEVNGLLGNTISEMVGYDQRSPHHCYDLMMHTLHTVDAVPENAPFLLRVAAFLHDIGKPDVAVKKKDRLIFHGHSEKSAELARPFLTDMGYSDAETDLVCFWVKYHDTFMLWRPEKENGPEEQRIKRENVYKKIKKIDFGNQDIFAVYDAAYVWRNLLILMKADAMAHADQVFRDGKLIDTNAAKLQRVEMVETFVNEYFKENSFNKGGFKKCMM